MKLVNIDNGRRIFFMTTKKVIIHYVDPIVLFESPASFVKMVSQNPCTPMLAGYRYATRRIKEKKKEKKKKL